MAEVFNSDTLKRGVIGELSVIGAILKSQEVVTKDLAAERNTAAYLKGLFLATFLLAAGYGCVLGMHALGMQTLFAAAKLPIVILGTAILCTPTFYVFNSILGSKLTLPQTLVIVFLMTAATSVILAAFAPIAWFFTVSTNGISFLVVLHVVIFLIAIGYSMRLIGTTRSMLNYLTGSEESIRRSFLRLWFVIVIFVGLQMAYSFRPFIVPGPFHTGERGLFFEGVRETFYDSAGSR
jgi:hypothetical protein